MEIGKTERTTVEPRPTRVEPMRIPVKPWPVREPEYVPARRGTPERQTPLKAFPEEGLVSVRQIGNRLVELPYSCPRCQRTLIDEDGMLACPLHGVVLDYEALSIE